MTQPDRKSLAPSLLGMPLDTAKQKLTKLVLLELLRLNGADCCRKCGLPIDGADNLSLEHIHDWTQDPAQFWNVRNVQFACTRCSPDIPKITMSTLTSVRLLDAKGRALPCYTKWDKHFYAGELNQPYTIEIRNQSATDLEVVVSVDGLDVMTGELGDPKKNKGYVLRAFGRVVIEGWRQNLKEVAAFKFGTGAASYAGRTSGAQNIGLIGVAVFQAKPKPVTVQIPVVVPVFKEVIVPVEVPVWPYIRRFMPPRPWCEPIWIGGSLGSGGVLGSNISHSVMDSPQMQCNVGQAVGQVQGSIPKGMEREIKTSGDITRGAAVNPQLGTVYGETVASAVSQVTFERATEDPCEMVVVEYDTRENLVRQGIVEEIQHETRDPFPGRSNVAPGFAQPPR